MPDKLYRSHSLETSQNNGETITSGSLTFWEDYPSSPFDVGDTFIPVEGGPALTVEKVSIKDSVIGELHGKPLRQWEITVEGRADDSSSETQNSNEKYSFSTEQDSSGSIYHSGSIEITNTEDEPTITHKVGDKISLPGVGEITCTKISGSDSYTDSGRRKWTILYEGSDSFLPASDENSGVKYTLNIENNSDGVTVYSGSKEISCSGNAPNVPVSIGDKFSLPFVGEVSCTRIHSNNEGNTWSVIIEGSRSGNSSSGDDSGDDSSLPETETVITYEINGSTVRSVSGEFIALRRSATPITKKSITVYSNSAAAVATQGGTYEGGIVTSESITRETIKSNGVVTGSYYKHIIEVEA